MSVQQIIRGETAALMWTCSQCGREWPVTAEDHVSDQRDGAERRTKTRGPDRRNS